MAAPGPGGGAAAALGYAVGVAPAYAEGAVAGGAAVVPGYAVGATLAYAEGAAAGGAAPAPGYAVGAAPGYAEGAAAGGAAGAPGYAVGTVPGYADGAAAGGTALAPGYALGAAPGSAEGAAVGYAGSTTVGYADGAVAGYAQAAPAGYHPNGATGGATAMGCAEVAPAAGYAQGAVVGYAGVAPGAAQAPAPGARSFDPRATAASFAEAAGVTDLAGLAGFAGVPGVDLGASGTYDPFAAFAPAIPAGCSGSDPPGAIRYAGTVTSFSTATAWGFIACPDLQSRYSKDIFFHVKDCGGATISKGQKVTFLLEEGGPGGKPRARCVQGAQQMPDPPHAVRYTGTVTSFSISSAWGFISCPATEPVFGKDIFFHLKDCGGSSVAKGQQVTFILDENASPQKPQARSVQAVGEEGALQVMQTQVVQGPASLGRYRGTVTNYSFTTAWGFISCPELNAVFGKDIFFHHKDCNSPVAKGATVTFSLDPNSDTTRLQAPKARDIIVEGIPGGPTNSALALAQQGQQPQAIASLPAGDTDQAALLAQQRQQAAERAQPILQAAMGGNYTGTIQSFSSQAGWGFINCPSLGLASGRGIFFHLKDCQGLGDSLPNRGAVVTFSVGKGPSGREQAVNVLFTGTQAAASPAPAPGSAAAAAAAAAAAVAAQLRQRQEEEQQQLAQQQQIAEQQLAAAAAAAAASAGDGGAAAAAPVAAAPAAAAQKRMLEPSVEAINAATLHNLQVLAQEQEAAKRQRLEG